MPKIDKEVPSVLRPFLFHGLDLRWEDVPEAVATCCFCDRESKLFVNKQTGQWNCRVCGVHGNAITFIRSLFEYSSIDHIVLEEVALERKVSPEVLQRWGFCQSAIDHEFLLPGFSLTSTEPRLDNLYRWTKAKGGKRRLYGTATMDATLFGMHLWDPAKPDVYICEGPWDAMALEDALSKHKWMEDGELHRTIDPEKSLLASCNIIAVPGCETFRDEWLPWLRGKNVSLLYDNDYPRKNRNNATVPPAGTYGMKKTGAKLHHAANSVKVLWWGDEGYDPQLPDGTDTRDMLTKHDTEPAAPAE